jgi:Flp pilus assembly protein TadB
MTNGHSPNDVAVRRPNDAQEDWPTLLGKLFEDFTRVLRGEVRLLGANVEPALQSAIVRGLNHMILAVIGLCGILCLIAAMVLLLHTWLEWWQAFGATGFTVILVVIVGSRASRPQTV